MPEVMKIMEMNLNNNKNKYNTLQNTMYLIKNMWRWNKALLLLSIIQIPMKVMIPLLGIYIPKLLVDSIINDGSLQHLLRSIVLPIVGLIALTVMSRVVSAIISGKAPSYRVRYMKLISEKILDTDFENIDGPVGMEKFMKAMMAMNSNSSPTQTIANLIIEFSSNIVGFILYAGIISTLHPIIVIFIVISSVINYCVGRYVNNYEHKNKDNLAPIERKLKYIREKTGDFKSAKDMRLYNMSSWFQEMYSIFLKRRLYFQKKAIYRRYFANVMDGLLILLRDGLAYGFLIYSVIYQDMTIGEFILYFGAVAGFSTWLTGIVKEFNSLNAASLVICDLRDYLEMEDKMNRGKGVELPKEYELPCDIELRNLYYKYPGAEDYTIKNINLHIKKGEKLALVGANGVGKTTLVKLICGLYTPTSGEIYINGKKSSDYNRDEYYTLFSVVFQDIHLLPLSIEQNISLKLEKDIDHKKVDEVLHMSGLMEKVNSLPKGKKTILLKSIYEEAIDLSGGEMQN